MKMVRCALYTYNIYKIFDSVFDFCLTVPGVVSDLTGQPKFTSIVLTWSAPQEPNGVIISYEVTYRVSDGNLVTANTTDLRFTIPSLTPGTNVTEISVSAYTRVGRGEPKQIPYLLTTTMPRRFMFLINDCNDLLIFVASVMKLGLDVLSARSVNVSWERIDTTLTSYIVYYSLTESDGMEFNISSTNNSVVIEGLIAGVEYQFQVVAVLELDGDVVIGERSNVSIVHLTHSPATTVEIGMQTNLTPYSGDKY